MILEALFLIAKNWKQPTCLQVEKQWTICDTIVKWNINQQWKQQMIDLCNNVDVFLKHCTQ